MIEQGFDFYLSDDSVWFENQKKQKKIGFEYEAPLFYNSDLIYTKVFINNILYSEENDSLTDMKQSPINIVSNNIDRTQIDIIIENLSFELEETDHIKILYGFDTDRREGQINLLL